MRGALAFVLLVAGCASTQGTQHRSLAQGIDLYATRWGPTTLNDGSVEVSPATAQRLRERYGDHASFIVVLELANRPPASPKHPDPMLDPAAWAFSLHAGTTTAVPSSVELVAHDRFVTSVGGHHERVALAVHFAKVPNEGAATLRVKAKAKRGRRAELGWVAANRGIALRFDADS